MILTFRRAMLVSALLAQLPLGEFRFLAQGAQEPGQALVGQGLLGFGRH